MPKLSGGFGWWPRQCMAISGYPFLFRCQPQIRGLRKKFTSNENGSMVNAMENPWGHIDAALKAQGMSLKELSEQSGVSETTLQRWKNGVNLPTFSSMNKIEKVINGRIAKETKAPR